MDLLSTCLRLGQRLLAYRNLALQRAQLGLQLVPSVGGTTCVLLKGVHLTLQRVDLALVLVFHCGLRLFELGYFFTQAGNLRVRTLRLCGTVGPCIRHVTRQCVLLDIHLIDAIVVNFGACNYGALLFQLFLQISHLALQLLANLERLCRRFF